MTGDDLIARLIAGPGSRELDLAVEMECGLVELNPGPEGRLFKYRSTQTGALSNGPFRKLTTSIDAAVAFAVAVCDPLSATYFVHYASRKALVREECSDGQDILNALPRYIVAEVLKARGDD